uniref:Glucosylceramidase n=1 Tax=Plectus sambesii TaxID=2011161 RepID=A0A914WLT6_9BILA
MDGPGWLARGDFKAPESHRKPFNKPTFRQALAIIPMMIRYIVYYLRAWWEGRVRFIDFLSLLRHKPFYGVPCGGIGCGGIGRDFRGGFCKFSLRPGIVEQRVGNVKADQFIVTVRSENRTVYQKVLTAVDVEKKTLSAWDFSFPASDLDYRGLYPRSWTRYNIKSLGLVLTCRQISPVIPHDYENTSMPATVFVWDVENKSEQNYDVTISFTFRNGTGDKRWNQEGHCASEPFQIDGDDVQGIALHHTICDMPCTYVLATRQTNSNAFISTSTFDPSSDGEQIWNELLDNGHFVSHGKSHDPKELGVAICSQFDVTAQGSASAEFALVWHMPLVRFGGKKRLYKRRYAHFLGTEPDAAKDLARRALISYADWEQKIEQWQAPVLENSNVPDWYKSALFNELYFMTDGGSLWMEFDESWRQTEAQMSDYSVRVFKEFGRFGYLESWEYYMINTYDVHFYASFALLSNWPQLQHSLQADFTDQVLHTDNRDMVSLSENKHTVVKTYGCLPHDMGHPGDDPWLLPNAYMLHDTGDWKDLNLKFVLTAYRDHLHIMNGDLAFLKQSYPSIERIIKDGLAHWDIDGDGLIENSGFPDQTYDIWVMKGSSAYCGSLWLAALQSARRIAELLDKKEDADFYEQTLNKARKAFVQKLWTGDYFKFDEHSSSSETVMADQLCGYWFLQA